MKLSDLKYGDRLTGFEGCGCIADDAICTVESDEYGLYVYCIIGAHYLDGHEDENGELLGLTKV